MKEPACGAEMRDFSILEPPFPPEEDLEEDFAFFLAAVALALPVELRDFFFLSFICAFRGFYEQINEYTTYRCCCVSC